MRVEWSQSQGADPTWVCLRCVRQTLEAPAAVKAPSHGRATQHGPVPLVLSQPSQTGGGAGV